MAEQWNFRRARPIAKNGKTLVMGVVNLTPDSFSTGDGRTPSPAEAVGKALAMIAEGADVIDFGAESSRPGAEAIAPDEEINRLGDVVKMFRSRSDAPVSVDSYHYGTIAYVLDQGADIVNDVTALRGDWNPDNRDSAAAELAAREKAHVILMHMPGPAVETGAPAYADVVGEVRDFLADRAEFAVGHGVDRDMVWLDPGFGFGKNFRHNRELLLRLGEFADTGFSVAVGMSRKRMIADALGLPPGERLEAGLALAVVASLTGADLVRVHDVRATARAVGMADAVRLGVERE